MGSSCCGNGSAMVWQEKGVIDLFVVKWKVEVMWMGWWMTVMAKGINWCTTSDKVVLN